MASVSPVLTALPKVVQAGLLDTVRPKFNAYFAFTYSSATTCVRSIPGGQGADGKAFYTYPDDSMISDLLVLSSLFAEVYELLKNASGNKFKANVIQLFVANPFLQFEFNRIAEDGEFWESPGGVRSLQLVPLVRAVPDCLPDIWRTLRNGFAHFHWRYENLSAQDYWTQQRWDTTSAQSTFNLPGRPAANYKAYIVDAMPPWTPHAFWEMSDLRIIVTQYGTLRYHLHRFLNIVLNGDNRDVFGNEPTEPCHT
jgi:hypothetical protein